MAKIAYTHSGSAIRQLRMKIATTFANAIIGTFGLDSADGAAGIGRCTATSAANCVGNILDSGTYSTTLGDVEGVVSVGINPDAVYEFSTVGTPAMGALTVTTNSAASAAGTVITITTGDPAPNSPTMDEGMALCVAGANVGQSRKITTVAATTATVTVPFTRALVSGDVFILIPWTPYDVAGNNVTLDGSQMNRAQQNIAVGTGAEFRIVEVKFDSSGQTAATQRTYVYAQSDDFWLNVTT